MKLNKQTKDELRQMIIEKLEKVSEGERIHIDKDILEDLIFEMHTNDDGDKVKLPVWTGEFLSKIDLSEISFKNVSMFDPLRGQRGLEKIIFKNTNALIDLNELYQAGSLYKCDFSGTKIMGEINFVVNCDLSNCGLSAKNFNINSTADTTNFTGNNLEGLIIKPEILYDTESYVFQENYTTINNYCNTGATILPETIKELTDAIKLAEKETGKNFSFNLFAHLEGCVTETGKVISSQEEVERKKYEVRKEYETFKQEIFNKVANSMDEQIAKKSK